MEPNAPLEQLHLDNQSKMYLQAAARWSRVLAIIGFVICGIILLIGIFYAFVIGSQVQVSYEGWDKGALAWVAGILAFAILVTVIYFLPCLCLFRFAKHTKTTLENNQQANLAISFSNLKSLFQYVGVLTLLMVVVYGLAFIFWVATILFSTPTHISGVNG